MEQPSATHAVFAQMLEDIGREDPERLRSAARRVAELVEHPGWAFLREIAEEKRRRIHRSYMPPTVVDHYVFVSLTGQEFGIQMVLDAPETVRIVAERAAEAQRKAAETAVRKQENDRP